MGHSRLRGPHGSPAAFALDIEIIRAQIRADIEKIRWFALNPRVHEFGGGIFPDRGCMRRAIDAAFGGGNAFGPDRHAAAPLSRWLLTI